MVDRADRQLAAGWYEGVSVRTVEVRRWLERARLPFVHPDRPAPPMEDVERTAQQLISISRRRSAVMSLAAGLAGPWAVPPEIAVASVSILRLAQRLAITFGFDPETDRGRIAMFRALADALDVELPERGPVGVRVSELPSLAMPNMQPENVALWLARAMLVKSALSVAGRITRFVPVLAGGVGAWTARRRTQALGAKMVVVYRRLAETPLLTMVEDAHEVEP